MRQIFLFLLSLAALTAAYVFGAWSFAQDLWPIHDLRNLKRGAVGEPQIVTQFDSFGRLTDWPGKQAVACPAQDARTAVVLFIGQSIQSNNAGQRYATRNGDKVLGWFDGRCDIAASPLRGTTGAAGEPMTLFGDRLVESGLFDRVVLAPSAIGGTGIVRWGAGGDLLPMLEGVLDRLKAQYRITHIVWHQGEDDFSRGVSTDAYQTAFLTLVDAIRRHGVNAPILVSVTSRCDDDSKWKPDNPVANALRALPDPARSLYAGVDTDALLLPIDRFDNCHLGATGVKKYAEALTEVFRRLR